jgi:Zn-dependent protease/CBS domain-containing protein
MSRSGFQIGNIFGIQVRVDWSWLLIFLLVSWNLAFVFNQIHPGWSAISRWSLAVFASILFFLSVLAHELSHSLVARARGMPVKNITLFLFGGVSNIQREPQSPGAEFVMAVVGPLTSIVIGVILVLISGISIGRFTPGIVNPENIIRQANPLITIFLWLGSVNLLLGIFNMIPAFPLDGGRVLRSILWAVTKSLRTATMWASRLGQLTAWVMILAGFAMAFGLQIPLLGSGFINGIWLAFIGWFLNSASQQSYQQVVIQDILGNIPVSQIMRPDPPTVSPLTTVSELVNTIMTSDDYAFPVLREGMLIGMVTMDDVRRVPQETWSHTTVGDIMTPDSKLVKVTREEDAAEAFLKLSEKDVRQLPVIFNGQFVGLLRRRDIVRWLQIHSNPARSDF